MKMKMQMTKISSILLDRALKKGYTEYRFLIVDHNFKLPEYKKIIFKQLYSKFFKE